MQVLVSTCWAADWPSVHMHAGDVDWWTVHSMDHPTGLADEIGLWFSDEDDSELIAFAWYGPPAETDFVVHPAHRAPALVGEMAAWFEDRVRRFGGQAGAEKARIWTVETETPTVEALEAAGYRPTGEPAYARYCGDLADLDLASPELPAGYRYATIETDLDIERRVEAGHAAFTGSRLTATKYRFCRTTPLYRADLDTIIVAPDGRIAAFTLAWFDPLTTSVELEPVGVAPDFWRRGLGTAVCRRALSMARDIGGRQAMIGAETENPASNALYGSLGLVAGARVVPFGRRS